MVADLCLAPSHTSCIKPEAARVLHILDSGIGVLLCVVALAGCVDGRLTGPFAIFVSADKMPPPNRDLTRELSDRVLELLESPHELRAVPPYERKIF